MPNWVNNYLTISKKDKDLVLDVEGNVDFGIIAPIPESFNRTISPTNKEAIYLSLSEKCTKKVPNDLLEKYEISEDNIQDAKELVNSKKERYAHLHSEDNVYVKNEDGIGMRCTTFITQSEYIDEMCEMGNRYIENFDNYGCFDWYDYQIEQWGCKWNAGDTDVTKKGNNLEIRFDTPWCPPIAWLEKLAEKCTFHLAWEEEQGYRGIIHNENGYIENFELPILNYDQEDGFIYEDFDWTEVRSYYEFEKLIGEDEDLEK